MRGLSTWMYFDNDQIKGNMERRRPRGEESEPGIGVAWFAGETSSLMPISNLKIFRELPGAHQELSLNVELLRNYLDLFLVDANEFEFDRPERSLKNPEVVEYLLSEPFVVERSPPAHLSLKGLITSTNLPVWIGSYMGWSIVPEHSVLLFITVPGGIIVVSSATGLASALAAGLNRSVKRLFRVR